MAASPFPTPKMASKMVRQDWGKWNLDIVFPMVYHNFYTEDISFISDCMIEDVRDKNPKTTLYCGLMVSDDMQASMDAALNHGAEGISIFTVSALRTPESRAMFKAYADSVVRFVPRTMGESGFIQEYQSNESFREHGYLEHDKRKDQGARQRAYSEYRRL